MKKIAAILLLLQLFFIAAFAQEENNSTPLLGTKIIKMPRFTIADFPKKSPAVSSIEIIQNLDDSVVLGFVQKGADGHIVQLKTEKPLTLLLQDHITKMYKNDYSENGSPMLWVLEKLRIAERTTFSNSLAYAKIKITSYLEQNGQGYKKLREIDSVFVMESGSDVTPWHGTHIEDAFRVLLHSSMKAAKEKTGDDKLYQKADIISASKKPENDSPILYTSQYKSGYYASFEELLQNNPSISNAETVAGKKGKVYILRASGNKKDTLNVWGLCQEGEIYKYQDNVLVPLERKGNGMVISDYVEKVSRKNSNLAAAAFFGGLIGAAIVNKNAPYIPLVTNIASIKKKGRYPEATCIDMSTGEFSF